MSTRTEPAAYLAVLMTAWTRLVGGVGVGFEGVGSAGGGGGAAATAAREEGAAALTLRRTESRLRMRPSRPRSPSQRPAIV